MATLKDQILALVTAGPGLTDQEIADRIYGQGAAQQSVNQAARGLATVGKIHRNKREDGKLGNYPGENVSPSANGTDPSPPAALSEDDVKRKLQIWLEAAGWTVQVAWGRGHGVDIEAQRDGQRWLIEVKGCGSRAAMQVNYFLAIIGELLQRMTDANAIYSIALPDLKQFRRLWQRLPSLAKSRTQITALFIGESGEVTEQRD